MSNSKICFVSVDVEHDNSKDQREFQGVESLGRILDIFKKYGVKSTLFVTGEVLSRYHNKIKEWAENYEIGCHGFSHKYWNTLGLQEREKELDDFFNLYRSTLGQTLQGFRAPSHVIDKEGLRLLERKGFSYDSSVVPHYPFFKKYRGYQGKAPLAPYHPDVENIRKRGDMKILEIPVAGQVLGLPLSGVWIAKIPFFIFQTSFALYSPSFITLNMHSWESFDDGFLKNLEKTLNLLVKKNYRLLSGKEIYESFSENRG